MIKYEVGISHYVYTSGREKNVKRAPILKDLMFTFFYTYILSKFYAINVTFINMKNVILKIF